jgi:hypothetical protein
MAARRQPPSDLDSPWKEALEHFLAPFLAFFFPAIHDAIDWQRGYESLDKELQQVVRDARTGRRLADKLFKVWRHDGREAWVLIHIEVQGHREKAFPERMFVYGYRIYDRYRRPVVSLAVLCDDQPDWRPDRFGYNVWGCSLALRFPVVKLLDYRPQMAALERERNPFAAVVLAQLKVLETRQDAAARRQWKVRLIKGLYERGLSAEAVRQLFRLIDWMMQLPQELEDQFWEEIYRFEEEQRMPYVTSVERSALKRGMRELIALALESKFGAAGKRLVRKIEAVNDVEQLRALMRAIMSAETVDEIRPLLR